MNLTSNVLPFWLYVILSCCLSHFSLSFSLNRCFTDLHQTLRSAADMRRVRLNMVWPISNALSTLNDKMLMENAERLGREESTLIGKRFPVTTMSPLPLSSCLKTMKDGSNLISTVLSRDGCASVRGVITEETADSLFEFITREKVLAESEVAAGTAAYDNRFGAVNNRRNRSDMFLPYSSNIVRKALLEAVGNLKPLLISLAGMEKSGILHELSCIISDPGSPTQCIHCDTPYLQNVAPLYTFFVALQDVDDDMGHTTFLPKTHVSAAHQIFNGPLRQKQELISSIPATRSALKKGDVAIFDSRVLHRGGANTSDSKKRILFYFTFTAGDVVKNNPNPSRGSGSIRDIDRSKYSLQSLLATALE